MEEGVLTTDKAAKTAQRWRFISQLAAKEVRPPQNQFQAVS